MNVINLSLYHTWNHLELNFELKLNFSVCKRAS